MMVGLKRLNKFNFSSKGLEYKLYSRNKSVRQAALRSAACNRSWLSVCLVSQQSLNTFLHSLSHLVYAINRASPLPTQISLDTIDLSFKWDNPFLSVMKKGLARISHGNRHEMSEMPSASRHATKGTSYVLSVHRRSPTERNTEDVGISGIAVDSGEKCGLGLKKDGLK